MSPTHTQSAADLSGMTGAATDGASLSTVTHKAHLAVDERGTSAAAATRGLIILGDDDEEFRADRPFLLFIRDTRSRAVVFVGEVRRPTNGSGEQTVDGTEGGRADDTRYKREL